MSAWIASDETQVSMTLTEQRELHRTVDTLIRGIYEKKVAWSARQNAYQQKIRCAYATVKADPEAMMAWQRLLNHLGAHSGLLSIEPVVPHLGPQSGNTFLDALLLLALRYPEWKAVPETWRAGTPIPREQFGSLARHLLVTYYVPSFLDAAWFEGYTTQGQRHRDWFVHIGVGKNIRTAEPEVHLTKMAAHHFLAAPSDFSIVGALRWGQVLGLGGDAYLAQAVTESRLGTILPDEPFWESVIHFCVNNARLITDSVGPMVDFVYSQKFGDAGGPQPDGSWDFSEAPEPDFTMKGRTLVALRKRMEEWHAQLAKDSKRPRTAWEPSEIAPFQVEERDAQGTMNRWTVVELLNSKALQDEGREMRHCVFTYASGCLNGTTSIWSLRVRPEHDMRTRRLLTIEVNMARRAIVQVRGRCNQTLGSYRGKGRMKTAGEMLRRWAREQRLSVACNLS